MYMLLNVYKEKNGLVSGNFMEWCSNCSLDEAIKRARETEKVNSNRINVAVVDELYDSYKTNYYNLKRLDK